MKFSVEKYVYSNSSENIKEFNIFDNLIDAITNSLDFAKKYMNKYDYSSFKYKMRNVDEVIYILELDNIFSFIGRNTFINIKEVNICD